MGSGRSLQIGSGRLIASQKHGVQALPGIARTTCPSEMYASPRNR